MKKYLLSAFLFLCLICVILLLINSYPKTKAFEGSEQSEKEVPFESDSLEDVRYDILQNGKTLFNNYCAVCHNKNMKDDLTGPSLNGSIGRWNNDSLGILVYLRSAQLYFENKPSKRMMELHSQYKNVVKPNFENLTLEEVKSIIEYIEMRYQQLN